MSTEQPPLTRIPRLGLRRVGASQIGESVQIDENPHKTKRIIIIIVVIIIIVIITITVIILAVKSTVVHNRENATHAGAPGHAAERQLL